MTKTQIHKISEHIDISRLYDIQHSIGFEEYLKHIKTKMIHELVPYIQDNSKITISYEIITPKYKPTIPIPFDEFEYLTELEYLAYLERCTKPQYYEDVKEIAGFPNPIDIINLKASQKFTIIMSVKK